MNGQQGAVQRLIELGFSQYEAQAYVGLLGREPLTGYALANVTGIPQPKVYETLHRLAAKGVVAAMEGEPARFVAVPADQLLAGLAESFQERLAGAQRELASATQAPGAAQYRVLHAYGSWEAIEERTVAAIDGSRRHVYLSVNCQDLRAVTAALERADGRGVVCDVLHFGSRWWRCATAARSGTTAPAAWSTGGTRRATWRWSPTAPTWSGRWPRTARTGSP